MALAIGGRRAEAERAYHWLVGLPAARRLLAPVLPGRLDRAGQARRQRHRLRGHRRVAPPPAVRTTTPSWWRCGPPSSRPSTSCSTCRRPAARSCGPATPTARPWSFALLTGSSSICHSLRCAIALAEHLGHERPDWELSAARLAHVITPHVAGELPDAFAPKHRWAMDWYYPVMTGVLRGEAGLARLDDRGVTPSSSTAWACAASATARGSPRPRRASACWPTSAWASATWPSSCSVGPAPAQRRRPLLHRHRVPRDGALPRRRAHHLHVGVDRAGRRCPGRCRGAASQLFVDHDLLPALIDADADATWPPNRAATDPTS